MLLIDETRFLLSAIYNKLSQCYASTRLSYDNFSKKKKAGATTLKSLSSANNDTRSFQGKKKRREKVRVIINYTNCMQNIEDITEISTRLMNRVRARLGA